MNFLKEFWEFLKVRKKYWLFPILLVLVMFGALIILSQGSAVNKILFYLQILFDKDKINLYRLKTIKKFDVKSYPMIVASKFDLNN